MTEYKPQKGDRVRVTIEGEVSIAHSSGYSGQKRVLLGVPGADSPQFWLNPEDPLVTVEKLADYNPEPEWVNGDVILIIGEAGKRTPMIYCAVGEFAPPHKAVWACSECSQGWHLPASVSEDWRSGDVEILYKANAA